MSIKRAIADFVERKLDVRIVKEWSFPILYEETCLRRFFEHFEIDCVFDVGANQGQYADRIRERCGFRGPIISFEPIPAHAKALGERAAVIENWFVEPILLNSAPGPVDFHITEGDELSSINLPNCGDLYKREAAISQTISMDASTLAVEFDKYQKRLGFRRAFLKMDTQGSDLAVARGAGDRLKRFVGLQSELSFKPLYDGIPSAEETLAFYRSQGFQLTAFVPNNSGHFPDLIEMDCILYHASESEG